ncbi:hypothetical protein Pst134EB_016816 [Puccinia striiformis f. sp. tritici]|uniref:Uncharacterized protein n=1 Tax=Puccinia striiformis f. sp. tritici PST-78 TaxID=1165861 RepID=A0A0L0VFW9_9BASI|nr:hypothetical protein Pst134EB_016816 [Puccinia striiformis f. sp. tritici]KNE98091.1 hypothetical protein PSTG_08764 [Puccinia striiformis f. sp. tritici PST-78]
MATGHASGYEACGPGRPSTPLTGALMATPPLPDSLELLQLFGIASRQLGASPARRDSFPTDWSYSSLWEAIPTGRVMQAVGKPSRQLPEELELHRFPEGSLSPQASFPEAWPVAIDALIQAWVAIDALIWASTVTDALIWTWMAIHAFLGRQFSTPLNLLISEHFVVLVKFRELKDLFLISRMV